MQSFLTQTAVKVSLAFHTFLPDIDECASAPCQNDGSCLDAINGYTCDCVDGYEGTDCEIGKFDHLMSQSQPASSTSMLLNLSNILATQLCLLAS